MQIPTWLAIAALVAACGTPERAPSGSATGSGPGTSTGSGSAEPAQTAREGFQLVCDAHAASGATTAAPAERAQLVSRWLGERIKNAEVRAFVDSLAGASERDARARVVAAAKHNGIESCAWPDAALPVPVPQVHSGTEPDADGVVVVVSRTELVYDGTAVIPLQDGAIDPGEITAGRADQLAVRRLVELVKAKPPAGRVRVAFDSALGLRTAFLVINSLARAGVSDVALLVLQNGVVAVLPVQTPRRDAPAELMAGVVKDQVVVWSRSGKHGTLKKPLVSAPLDGGLGELVRALATVRTASRDGLPRVALVLEDSHDVAQLARLIATIRPVFPSVTVQRGLP